MSTSSTFDPCCSIRILRSSRFPIQMSGSSFRFVRREFVNSFFSAIRDGALFVAYLFRRRAHAILASPSAWSIFLLSRTRLNATRPLAFVPSILKMRSVYAASFASLILLFSNPIAVVSSYSSPSLGAISVPRSNFL